MSRHLDHLQHLTAKLKGRYGEDDDSVRELERQLKQLEGLEAKGKKLRILRREVRDASRVERAAASPRLL